ncbi:MAG: hypothetical protein A7316_09925 [Candidatus Altiarchaeales archaeon WOR_SM1_86-2]|nr:MAG: hypothetical protein A7316_09925 [Candidatus Altiarchaeales archaeon WOR_SM1_86-2]
MEYLDREITTKLKKWIDRREIYAIKGPRQCGKTTLLYILKDYLVHEKGVDEDRIIFLNCEDYEVLEKFNKNSKEFISSYITGRDINYFFLDEFQYVEDGGRKLKILYDTYENAKFIITGSSSLELTGKTSKFLVGRVFEFNLYPFSFKEFLNAKDKRLARIHNERNEKFKNLIFNSINPGIDEEIFTGDFKNLFAEYVTYGGYPEVIKTDDKETKKEILKNIYNTYVTRDVIELLKIRDVFKFRKIVSVLSSQLGGIANYNELSSVCESYYKELMEILDVLEETFIIKRVTPFYRNLKTELKKNPKVYFVDSGLRNYTINNFAPVDERTDKGEIIENFVLNQLNQLLSLSPEYEFRINYWRTLGKAEVDFILNFQKKIIPVEVKYKKFQKPEVTRSFRSFLSSYQPDNAVLLTKNYSGKMNVNGINISFIPVWYV